MSVDQETFLFQQEHEKLASESAKNLGRKPRTALMEILFQYQICGRSETLRDRYADSWRSPFLEKYQVHGRYRCACFCGVF